MIQNSFLKTRTSDIELTTLALWQQRKWY